MLRYLVTVIVSTLFTVGQAIFNTSFNDKEIRSITGTVLCNMYMCMYIVCLCVIDFPNWCPQTKYPIDQQLTPVVSLLNNTTTCN